MLRKIKHVVNCCHKTIEDTNNNYYHKGFSMPDHRVARKVEAVHLDGLMNSPRRVGLPRSLKQNRAMKTENVDASKQAGVAGVDAEGSAADEFETASEGKGKDLDTMLAALRVNQVLLETKITEKIDKTPKEDVDNTFVGDGSESVNKSGSPISQFNQAHPRPLIIRPAELASAEMEPLKMSANSDEMIEIMAMMNTKANTLQLEVSRIEDLAERLCVIIATFDEISKRSEQIQLIVQMSSEDRLVLTETDKDNIGDELLHINTTDLALDDEYAKIKAEWETLVQGEL